MAKKPNIVTVTTGYQATDTINDNFQNIRNAFDNVLSRDGSLPNHMDADLDMDSNDILNVNTLSVNGLYINGLPVTPSAIQYNGVTKETQVATSGQTVFNLSNITYTPGINNLSVYVDGVYQKPANYTETDADTVTFSVGLHVGAIVDFVVLTINTLPGTTDAVNVTYTPQGVGAVTTTVSAKLKQYVSVKDFGAVGDGVTDDTVAIQAAIDSGVLQLSLVGGNYRITTSLVFDENNMTISNGTLLFDGNQTTRLAKITGDNVTFQSVIFDGNNKQPLASLVYVEANTERPVFNGCTFKDITGVYYGTTSLNQTCALLINPYAVTNFKIVNCLFKDLIKYNDGVNTVPPTPAFVGGGFIGGVYFLQDNMAVPTAPQPTPTSGFILGCTFENIQTILAAGLNLADQANLNDADAIRTYAEPGGAEILSVHVADCVFKQCSKRAFKFRAAESVAQDCEIYADGMQYGMIVPVDVTDNTKVQNVKIYASVSKPVQSAVQWSVGPLSFNRETLIQGLFVSHCIVGIGFFSDLTNQPLSNLVLRDIFINQASAGGIRQGSPLPSSMENIVVENVQIFGSGDNCTGISIAGGIDNSANVRMNNVLVVNGSVGISGINNLISNLEIQITSSTFAGETTSQPLCRIGSTGFGGFQKINSLFINAVDINSGFLSATRPQLITFIGDNGTIGDVRIKVPETLSVSYPHAEMWGKDMHLDGLQYDGPGIVFFGTQAALARGTIQNAVRMSNNGSSSADPFLYTNNASTTQVALMNITDLRPTTASSIVINNGTEFIVYNVASKSSNGTIVQGGGVTTTANINAF